jgi:iron complex transport system substrate-binding protein
MKNVKSVIFVLLLGVVGLLLSWQLMGIEFSGIRLTPLSGPVNRVITFNPAAAEVIYELGAQAKLVGVSGFCSYPPDVANKVQVGDAINPDYEKLRILRPDLVIIMGKNDKLTIFCNGIGSRVLRLDMYNVDGLLADIEVLGAELGCSERAASLCGKIEAELAAVKAKVAGLERKRVFLSFFRSRDSLTELSTAGGGTHLNNLVEIAGGENIYRDLKLFYPTISKESLLKAAPEVIIEPRTADELTGDAKELYRQQWSLLGSLPAVKTGSIYFPDADLILKPGPRVGEAAMVLARMIHPEIVD